MLTYGEVKKFLSKYAGSGGKCPDSEATDLFVRKVLQYLLFNGGNGYIVKMCFSARNGCFTVPHEVEAITHIKLEGEVGNVWNMWKEFSSIAILPGCMPCEKAAYEEPGYFPTDFDLPSTGGRFGVQARDIEDPTSHVIVQGIDLTGREVYTKHEGKQVKGEYLTLDYKEPIFSTVRFSKITGVTKTKTKGYVTAYAHDDKQIHFLSDYTPNETIPAYRRYRLHTPSNGIVKVSALARLRLKDSYADNDLVPFETYATLETAAITLQAMYNKDFNAAQAGQNFLDTMIRKENVFKTQSTHNVMEISRVLGSGNIRSLRRGYR